MTSLTKIINKIRKQNPLHSDKIEANCKDLGEKYIKSANLFFDKYIEYLERKNMTLDFGVDCYLRMIEDMLEERYKFIRNGNYSNTSFEDVEKRIYGNSEIMDYHMNGLVLAQYLWFEQYERILFFKKNIKNHIVKKNNYLEIGGGHGLYIFEAINTLPEIKQFDLVDISQSSLNLAKGILNDNRINFYLKNIFDFKEDEKYDFVTMGEVLEHVENPLDLLKKAGDLLSDEGVFFITTPINSPMIDHIYLFNNEKEIRDIIVKAGFNILEEKIVVSEKISVEKAAKYKVPIMYAAFLKKI